MRTPTPPPCAQRPERPRGIALLMALAVVMLLTFFMSEFFFATGLELRGMTTFKDSERARMLARAVFKTVQVGLMDDEVLFFEGYRPLNESLQFAALPWSDGLLLTLDVLPQDQLYNLNQHFNTRQGEPEDKARRALFRATLEDVTVRLQPAAGVPAEERPIDPYTLDTLYTGIVDWIDGDVQDYIDIPGVVGGEASAYLSHDPELRIKNGQLDRLEELRLVRGLVDSGIPWGYWQQRFTTLARVSEGGYLLKEKINVNLASREEIQRFLEDRLLDATDIGGDSTIIEGVNDYATRAEEIAEFFAPADGQRTIYTDGELSEALKTDLALNENYGRFVLSTISENYRVRIVTEVGGVRARLEALIYVKRDPGSRLGSPPEIRWITLQ